MTEGEILTLTVSASVTQGATLEYQWYKGSTALTSAGATSPTLFEPAAESGDSGSYTVHVSAQGAITVISDVAIVTVV